MYLSMLISISLMIVLSFLLYIIAWSSSPGLLLMLFLGTCGCSVFLLFMGLSDMLAYLLFLVYVGGLLVLLIYMIMMSSNYHNWSSSVLFVVSSYLMLMCTCMLYFVGEGAMYTMKESSMILPMEFSSLVMMGLMLLIVFINICNLICVGGRTLNVGEVS